MARVLPAGTSLPRFRIIRLGSTSGNGSGAGGGAPPLTAGTAGGAGLQGKTGFSAFVVEKSGTVQIKHMNFCKASKDCAVGPVHEGLSQQCPHDGV